MYLDMLDMYGYIKYLPLFMYIDNFGYMQLLGMTFSGKEVQGNWVKAYILRKKDQMSLKTTQKFP